MPNLLSLFQKRLMNAYWTSHNTLCETSSSSLPLPTSGAGLSRVCEFGSQY